LSVPKRDQPECKFDDLAIDVVNKSSQAARAELPAWITMQTGHAVQYLLSHTKVLTTANLAPLLSKSLSGRMLHQVCPGLKVSLVNLKNHKIRILSLSVACKKCACDFL